MTQAGNIQNNSVNQPYGYDSVESYGKAYGTNYSKNLGGADPELASYYENELLPYWRAVQSGEIQVSQEEFYQLQQWMQYTEYELGVHSSGWGDFGGAPGMGGAYGPNQGAAQNATITDGGDFMVDGSCPVTDVWGSETTMNVPPPCTVSFETTTDTRFNPAETVVKAVITNPAMKGPDGQPAQSVVYFHDGVKITCNASKKGDGTSRVTDHTGSVTVGEYKAGVEEGGTPEASIEGEYDATTNTYTYDGTGQDAIKFWPQGSGVDGEITTHVVEASAEIYVKNTDRVYVYEKDGQWITDVVHKDGSVDRFAQDKSTSSYTCNINGVPEHIFFGANENHEGGSNPTLDEGAEGEDDQMKIPGGFGEHFTVNGVESAEGGGMLDNIGLIQAVGNGLLTDTVAEKYPESLVSLADYLFGKHDKATMDGLMAQLEATFGQDYQNAMLGKAAKDKISFAEWIKGEGAQKLNPSNGKFISFLFQADPTLAALFNEVKGKPVHSVEGKLKNIQTELIGVLNAMFGPGTAVSSNYQSGMIPNEFTIYGVKVGGKTFSLYDPNQSFFPLDDPKVGDAPTWIPND